MTDDARCCLQSTLPSLQSCSASSRYLHLLNQFIHIHLGWSVLVRLMVWLGTQIVSWLPIFAAPILIRRGSSSLRRCRHYGRSVCAIPSTGEMSLCHSPSCRIVPLRTGAARAWIRVERKLGATVVGKPTTVAVWPLTGGGGDWGHVLPPTRSMSPYVLLMGAGNMAVPRPILACARGRMRTKGGVDKDCVGVGRPRWRHRARARQRPPLETFPSPETFSQGSGGTEVSLLSSGNRVAEVPSAPLIGCGWYWHRTHETDTSLKVIILKWACVYLWSHQTITMYHIEVLLARCRWSLQVSVG